MSRICVLALGLGLVFPACSSLGGGGAGGDTLGGATVGLLDQADQARRDGDPAAAQDAYRQALRQARSSRDKAAAILAGAASLAFDQANPAAAALQVGDNLAFWDGEEGSQDRLLLLAGQVAFRHMGDRHHLVPVPYASEPAWPRDRKLVQLTDQLLALSRRSQVERLEILASLVQYLVRSGYRDLSGVLAGRLADLGLAALPPAPGEEGLRIAALAVRGLLAVDALPQAKRFLDAAGAAWGPRGEPYLADLLAVTWLEEAAGTAGQGDARRAVQQYQEAWRHARSAETLARALLGEAAILAFDQAQPEAAAARVAQGLDERAEAFHEGVPALAAGMGARACRTLAGIRSAEAAPPAALEAYPVEVTAQDLAAAVRLVLDASRRAGSQRLDLLLAVLVDLRWNRNLADLSDLGQDLEVLARETLPDAPAPEGVQQVALVVDLLQALDLADRALAFLDEAARRWGEAGEAALRELRLRRLVAGGDRKAQAEILAAALDQAAGEGFAALPGQADDLAQRLLDLLGPDKVVAKDGPGVPLSPVALSLLAGHARWARGERDQARSAYLDHLAKGGRARYAVERLLDGLPAAGPEEAPVVFHALVDILHEVPVAHLGSLLAGLAFALGENTALAGEPADLDGRWRSGQASAGELLMLWSLKSTTDGEAEEAQDRAELLDALAQALPGHPYVAAARLDAVRRAGEWDQALPMVDRALGEVVEAAAHRQDGYPVHGEVWQELHRRVGLLRDLLAGWGETGVLEERLWEIRQELDDGEGDLDPAGLRDLALYMEAGSQGLIPAETVLGVVQAAYERSEDPGMRQVLGQHLAAVCRERGDAEGLEALLRRRWADETVWREGQLPEADADLRMLAALLAGSQEAATEAAASGVLDRVRDALDQDPTDALALCLHVEILRNQGAAGRALRTALSDCLKAYPRTTWAQEQVLDLHREAGDHKALARFAEDLAGRLPADEALGLVARTAQALLGMGKIRQAQDWAQRLPGSGPLVAQGAGAYRLDLVEAFLAAGQAQPAGELLEGIEVSALDATQGARQERLQEALRTR